VDPRAGLDDVKKITFLPPPGLQLQSIIFLIDFPTGFLSKYSLEDAVFTKIGK
jgi:hypothetical protein